MLGTVQMTVSPEKANVPKVLGVCIEISSLADAQYSSTNMIGDWKAKRLGTEEGRGS